MSNEPTLFDLVEDIHFDGESSIGAEEIMLVCHQHILPSVVPLFNYLSEHICPANNIFILGKIYSTIEGSASRLKKMGIQIVENNAAYHYGKYQEAVDIDVTELWNSVLRHADVDKVKRIIILDEGGYLAKNVPAELLSKSISVEQTAFGIFNYSSTISVVNVAQSYAKRVLEAPSIAKAIVHRLVKDKVLDSVDAVGILGAGSIGAQIGKAIQEKGLAVFAYDINQQETQDNGNIFSFTDSASTLAKNVDLIIGCSGRSSLNAEALKYNKVSLVSASSGDIEFSQVLSQKPGKREDVLETVYFSGDLNGISILNGGFPYNFTTEYEIESEYEMLLTRALMVLGTLQALRGNYLNKEPSIIPLKMDSQLKLISNWRAYQESDEEALEMMEA